ncbi:MAG: hypothetical protein VXX01_03300, partial [Pseudomonadota bacterium]|nr:hypothetical protein [Pseudomonadota bacterium]
HDREAYSAGLSQGFVRFDRARAHELLERARQTVEPGPTEAGRRHYQQACNARDRNDRYTAREEIRMALLFEPSEPQFLILAEQLKGG